MRKRVEIAPACRGILCVVAAVSIAAVTVAGCGPRKPPATARGAGGPEIVEGGAVFSYFDPDARKVHLVGDFNQWLPDADPMKDDNGDGNWTLFYPLAPGKYQYKFVVDGRMWIPDPTNPVSVADGFSGRNSVVTIPSGEGDDG